MPLEKPSPNPQNPAPPSAEEQLTEKIEALTAHIPDDDERAELAAHLDDLTTAYLTGQRHLSPEDALLLATSHLGPASLQPSHGHASSAALFGAGIGATALVWFLSAPLAHLARYALIAPFTDALFPLMPLNPLLTATCVLAAVMIAGIAARYCWRAVRARGEGNLWLWVSPALGALAMDRARFSHPHPWATSFPFDHSLHGPMWIYALWNLLAAGVSVVLLARWSRLITRPSQTPSVRVLAAVGWVPCIAPLFTIADPEVVVPLQLMVTIRWPWVLCSMLLALTFVLAVYALRMLSQQSRALKLSIAGIPGNSVS